MTTTQTAHVDGRPVHYSVVRVFIVENAPISQVLPHPHGQCFAALCRECGFGALGISEEQAAHTMLGTMNGYRHGHVVSQALARVKFDPQLIDHIYDAYNPETHSA